MTGLIKDDCEGFGGIIHVCFWKNISLRNAKILGSSFHVICRDSMLGVYLPRRYLMSSLFLMT